MDAQSSPEVAAAATDGALTAGWRALADAAAQELAAALRAGTVPRLRRAQARALLAEAYARLEDGATQPEGTTPPRRALATYRRLAFALDRAATPPTPPIPRPGFRSRLRAPGAVDGRRVARIVGYWEWAEGLTARSAAFLEAAGFGAGGGLGLRTARDVVEGAPPEVDRVLTEG